MSDYLNKIIYLSKEQYQSLLDSTSDPKSIQVNGTTYQYDANSLYITNDKGDADTVNGHSVYHDVPFDAVFTDTNIYHTSGGWTGLTYTAQTIGGTNDASQYELSFTLPTKINTDFELNTINTTASPGLLFTRSGTNARDWKINVDNDGNLIFQSRTNNTDEWTTYATFNNASTGLGTLTLNTLNGNATSASTALGLTNKTLTATTINSTAGSYAFSINATTELTQITTASVDYTGLQIGDSKDKWQLTAIENHLYFRQNDSGGTNTASWNNWVKILDNTNYTDYAAAADHNHAGLYMPINYSTIDYTSTTTTNGIYPHSSSSNPVTNSTEYGGLIQFGATATNQDYYAAQLLVSSTGTTTANVHAYIRRMTYSSNNGKGWSGWSTLLDNNNYTDYTVTKTGVGATGDWAITAAKATADADNNVITTTYATKTEVNGLLASQSAMTFKGTLGTNGDFTSLPASHNAGDTYRVITAGDWAGKTCVVGDLIICINTGTTASDADWTSVETNEDGAVIGPAATDSTTDNAVVRWDSTVGRVIKNSGVTIDDNNNILTEGNVTLLASASGLSSSKRVKWVDSNDALQAYISSTTTGNFGINALGDIYLRPGDGTDMYTGNGIIISQWKIYAASVEDSSLGTNSRPWTTVYGNTFTGNAASATTSSTLTHTLATTTKYYLSGTTLTATGSSGATFDTDVYSTATAGELSALRYSWHYSTNEKAYTQWNDTDQSIDFIFL